MNKKVFISSPLNKCELQRFIVDAEIRKRSFEPMRFDQQGFLQQPQQMKTIKGNIERCAYVFCIVDNAPGSMCAETKKTISHEEFLYALQKKKRTFVSIKRDVYDNPPREQAALVADIKKCDQPVQMYLKPEDLIAHVKDFFSSLSADFYRHLRKEDEPIWDYMDHEKFFLAHSIIPPFVHPEHVRSDPLFGALNQNLIDIHRKMQFFDGQYPGNVEFFTAQKKIIETFNHQLVLEVQKVFQEKRVAGGLHLTAIDFSIETIRPDVWRVDDHFLYVKRTTGKLAKQYQQRYRLTRYFVLLEPLKMARDASAIREMLALIDYHQENRFEIGLIPWSQLKNRFQGLHQNMLNFFQAEYNGQVTTYTYDIYKSCAVTYEDQHMLSSLYKDITAFIRDYNVERGIFKRLQKLKSKDDIIELINGLV